MAIQRIKNEKTTARIDTSFTHLLVAAIVHVGKEKGDHLVQAWHDGGWNVVFQVEGVDVPLEAIMNEWEKQLERMLAEKAAEIVNEKTGNILQTVESLAGEIRETIEKKVEASLGVKLHKED